MTEKTLPTPEELRKRLRYDPETGKLYWLRGVCEIVEAFTARDSGRYLNGRINQKTFRAHRVIWALVYGEWPKGEIDHINGQRDDNRLCNLRCVTRAENARNRARMKRNTSGRTGVYWQGRCGKWVASINGTYLGIFERFEDAVAARERAEIEHGYHPNHDRTR